MIDGQPSIVEVISRYTSLRRSGKEYTGLCPFHSEKTPSFTVNEEKCVFYCHGCGEGGDCIAFIMKIEGRTFKEALSLLGYDNQPQQTSAEIKRQQLIRDTSRNLTAWGLDMAERVGSLIRETGQREYMVTKVLNEFDSADKEILQNEVEGVSRE